MSNRLYLVKQGTFRSTMQVPLDMELDEFKGMFDGNKIDMAAFKENKRSNQLKVQRSKHRLVDVCYHVANDLFGYADLLSEEDAMTCG